MAKIYYTNEVREVIDEFIKENGMALVTSKSISEADVGRFAKELRIFSKYADELIEKMEIMDKEDDEKMAAWRAKREAEEAKAAEEKPDDK